jgi:hypothetical protein
MMKTRQIVKVTFMGLMMLAAQGVFGLQTVTAQSHDMTSQFSMSSNVKATVQLAYDPKTNMITYTKLSNKAPSAIVLGFESGDNRAQAAESKATTLLSDTGEISVSATMGFLKFMSGAGNMMNQSGSSGDSKTSVYIAAFAAAGMKDDGKTVKYGKQVSNVVETTL